MSHGVDSPQIEGYFCFMKLFLKNCVLTMVFLNSK